MEYTRRTALVGGGAAAALLLRPACAAAANATAFSWDQLRVEALRLARRPYVPAPAAPAGAAAISYDMLNHIGFRPERTLWGTNGTPGVRLFPLSRSTPLPVEIAVVEDGHATPIMFDRGLFAGEARLPSDAAGFSGFRLMAPKGDRDWLAFQGASYFRAAGAFDQYGLSARALAIDTGLDRAEEFPRFTRFWLERGSGKQLIVHALLDSPSVAGAWRFVCERTPKGVTQTVSATMMFRRPVARLGLAPLTSMFWYGEGDRAQATDWRPEIHDSDGLAMLTGAGERIWRPLHNPARATTNSFADAGPRGFGLLQRDRAFDHYQDDGVFYERRPSLWVEPLGDWGRGAVTLVELPTRGETEDNVVAFWTPAAPPRPGQATTIDYRLRWIGGDPAPSPLARVADCWRGTAGPPGSPPRPGLTRVVADFAGEVLTGLGRDGGVTAHVDLDRGKPVTVAAYPVVGAAARWRLIVDLPAPGSEPVNLRAYLARGAGALTETLLYQVA